MECCEDSVVDCLEVKEESSELTFEQDPGDVLK